MLAALLAAAVLAATPTVNLDKLFAKPVASAKQQLKIPILLPKSMPAGRVKTKLYVKSMPSIERYEFRVTTTKNCEANYCFFATFSAQLGDDPITGQRVSLAKGRKGTYSPRTCGASCAPAVFVFRDGAVSYRVETLVANKRQLITMANQAIRRGAR